MSSCGPVEEAQKLGDSLTEVESQFNETSRKYKIPSKVLTVTAFVESNGFDSSFSLWEGEGLKGFQFGQVFGLAPVKPSSFVEEGTPKEWRNQIKLYAHWLKESAAKSNLPSKLLSSQDKFKWIWAVSKAHRSHKSTQAIFARELISAFNQGGEFSVYSTKKLVHISKDQSPLKVKDLDLCKKVFKSETQRGDLRFTEE